MIKIVNTFETYMISRRYYVLNLTLERQSNLS